MSSGLFVAGQTILVLLGSRTRAGGTYVTQQGIALLAPDSETYLESAASISEILVGPWTRWAYPGLLAAVDAIGLGLTSVVVIQAVMMVLAGTMVHALAEDATGSVLAGLAASATILVNPLTSQWVRFILTESLFMSIAVLAMWSITRLQRRWRTSIAVGALLNGLVATSMRPNGVLIMGATVAGIVLARTARSSDSRRRASLAVVWTMTAIALAGAAATTGQPGEASITSQLYRGVIIEGTEDVRMTIAMPDATDTSDESVTAAVEFSVEHPFAVSRLILARIAVEVAQVRPHYPTPANVAIGATMLLFLTAVALGLTDRRAGSIRYAGLTVALPILLLVGLTFAVPEGRYGWGGLVALAPLVGIGVDRTLTRLRPSRSARTRTVAP